MLVQRSVGVARLDGLGAIVYAPVDAEPGATVSKLPIRGDEAASRLLVAGGAVGFDGDVPLLIDLQLEAGASGGHAWGA